MTETPTPTKETPEISWEGYYEVTLNRAAVVEGHVYRPRDRHVVDASTLKALGDAVASSVPVK